MKTLPESIRLDKEGLTERQYFLLCAIAYLGERLSTYDLNQLVRRFGYGTTKIDDDLNTLSARGFIGKNYNIFWGFTVFPQYHLIVCLNGICYHPEWKRLFSSINNASEFSKSIWELSEAILGDRVKSFILAWLDRWSYQKEIAGYFVPIVFCREFKNVFLELPPQLVVPVYSLALRGLLFREDMNVENVDWVEELVKCSQCPDVDSNLPSLLACHRYLTFGTVPDPSLPDNPATLAVKAIQALYRDDNEGALALFGKSLKLNNKYAAVKNIYVNPLLTLMLMACYLRCNTPETRKKAQQLVVKQPFVDQYVYDGAMAIAARILHPTGTQVKPDLLGDRMRPIYNTELTRSVAKLAAAFLKYDAKACGLSQEDYSRTPRLAILRYELSGIMGKPIAELASAYGPHPVMASIAVKERWEVVMEDLTNSIAKEAQNTAADTRIVYLLQNNNTVEIREQRRLKNGSWGVGKSVVFSNYLGCSIACMNEADRQVAQHLRTGCFYSRAIPAVDVLPFLVGENRVFRETGSSREPVTITEEPPFIVVEPKKDRLLISTNVPDVVDSTGELCGDICIRFLSRNQVVVCKLNPKQGDILCQLIPLGSIPATAQEQTKKFLEAISGVIEVHSPLLEGGSMLAQRNGSSLIVLRMTPKADTFFVVPVVQPLPGGMLRLAPGIGKRVVFDEAEGERFQVTRDLNAEKENYAHLQESVGIDFDPDGTTIEVDEMLSLVEFVQAHPDGFAMEWLSGTQYKVKKVGGQNSVNVGLASKEGWFDIEGTVELDEGKVFSSAEFLKLMAEGLIGRRYVRLGEGEYAVLGEQLAKQLQSLAQLAQYDRKGAHIPRYQVGAIAEVLDKNNTSLKADRGFAQLKKKVQEAAELKVPIPSQLKAQLRDYQEEGFRWMARLTYWGAGACLADDMGLGKTVQTIALMLHRADRGAALVLSPASVLYNWKSELQRFAPTLDVTLLNEEEDRAAAISSAADHGVVLCTYGLLVREAELLRQKQWDLVVLDEAHTIKNRNTKMSSAAMDLQAEARILLTGTPVQNYLAELWNLFQFINPGLLGTFEHFTNRYILPIERDENKAVQSQLRRAISPFLLRRTKAEVVEELPEKTEIVHLVNLSSAERTAYEALRLSAQETMEEEQKVGVNVLSMITRLREAACSISLVSKEWAGGSSKIEAFKELVEQVVMGGNRVLVFSQFTSFLAQARKALDDMEGMQYLYLDGSTPTRRRSEMVKQFQHGDCPVFLISLKAGGLGLNLTGANYVIHLDPWWNPAIEQQATDRAYRIGQTQNVTVYHLVSDRTIEQKILRLHKTKREMADALLEGANVGHTMTLEDLRFLVDEE